MSKKRKTAPAVRTRIEHPQTIANRLYNAGIITALQAFGGYTGQAFVDMTRPRHERNATR